MKSLFKNTIYLFGDKINIHDLNMKLEPITPGYIVNTINTERGILLDDSDGASLYCGDINGNVINLDWYPNSSSMVIRKGYTVVFRGTVNSTKEFEILLNQLGFYE